MIEEFLDNYKLPQNEVVIQESSHTKAAALRIIGNPSLSPSILLMIGETSCQVDSKRLIAAINAVLWDKSKKEAQA